MTKNSATASAVSSDADTSKDIYFEKVGLIADEMIDAHGKEFAMGVLVLAARFIAEGRPLGKPPGEEPGDG